MEGFIGLVQHLLAATSPLTDFAFKAVIFLIWVQGLILIYRAFFRQKDWVPTRSREVQHHR